MASLFDRWRAAYNAFKSPDLYRERAALMAQVSPDTLPDNHRERLDLLRTYYEATAYRLLNDVAARRGVAGLKFLDNPAHQAVEFYPAHLFPGSLDDALPITFPRRARSGADEQAATDAPGGGTLTGEEDDAGSAQIENPGASTPADRGRTGEPLSAGVGAPSLGLLGAADPTLPPDPFAEPESDQVDPRDEALREAIRQVWEWSNLAAEKQVYARWLARDGEVFLKAASTEDGRRSFIELIDAAFVSDFEEDARGFLEYIRLDVPVEDEENEERIWTHTEVWDKAENLMRVWVHEMGPDVELETLGDPGQDEDAIERGEVDSTMTEFDIDFVPFVHVQFVDTGEERGVGVIEKFLEPIDEINRAVNRINEMFFRYGKPIHVLRRNEEGKAALDYQPDPDEDDTSSDTVDVGDERLERLPGNASLELMVAQVPYDQGVLLIDKAIQRLSNSLAELRFFHDVEQGDPSGISRRIRLQPAVSRAVEARGNAESGLIRATQMCLTLGKINNLFPEVGEFEDGDMDFQVEQREVLHVSDLERAEQDKVEAEALGLYSKLPPALFRKYLKDRGYDDDIIRAVVGDIQNQRMALPALSTLAGALDEGSPGSSGGSSSAEPREAE